MPTQLTQAKIRVYGSGCPNCKKLHETALAAVKELGLAIEVEYITDIDKIIASGIMLMPAMTLDEKIILAGQVPAPEKIKALIEKNLAK